ncbi:hypothetical protein COOONC_18789 [Cooperia oncophora]
MGKASVDIAQRENLEKNAEEEDNKGKSPEKKSPKKRKREESDSSDDEKAGAEGSSKRKAKKKKNQMKNKAKKISGVDDNDGFNSTGYIQKVKKEKRLKLRVGKRTLAKTSAKLIKNKRKKMLKKVGASS